MKKLLACMIISFFSGCVHPMVKFHKQALLDPTMDPEKTAGFHSSMRQEPLTLHERGLGDGGQGLGGTCPTCGG